MLSRRDEILVGLGVTLLAALTLWWLIPAYVVIPRRVPIKALSPAFWPMVIGWVMLICGLAVVIRAAMAPPPPDAIADDLRVSRPEAMRMGALAVLLIAGFYSLRTVGMVWTSMVLFVALVFLTGSKHRVLGVVAAILLPLALYFFFTKVAGVAIPQGRIVRLP
ncbi:tripartite tricarboxylate transporter TctB family protein [Natronohydrobacter thiooxidans]|jgi:putative tricarboxylic transport membrane protein|uniref:tripartite tricarboxylate transporter TctB family protein n=1 Tax=Natronohydrobacter thiooxidans TaxID=87172 RepID=UPI0008FF2687|nr:tripartite tricarboxylate transporter TctB family protein [Natronohydrobacter thiooxidans]